MKIGIIGSGAVAISLANGFIKHGHQVMLGTGNAEKHDILRERTAGQASIGSFTDAAAFSDFLVLAVKGTAAENVIRLTGIENLEGKTILDASNPIAELPPVNGVLQYFTSINESLMERLQKIAPGAKFVKCFSIVGNTLMVDPDFGDMKPTMFICGNDANAKSVTTELLTEIGWETEDMGEVEAARAIEPLCMLWCIPGFKSGQWQHAFKLLKK